MTSTYNLNRSTPPPQPPKNLLEGLNEHQKLATTHVDGPLLILAGAGSGKTRVMTHRIAYLIRHANVFPTQILAVTFTNKAAAEMRERTHQLLDDPSVAHYLTISTFHSLCARLLRRHAELVSLTRDFSIYDPADQKSAAKRVLEELNIDEKVHPVRGFLSYIDHQKNLGRPPKVALENAHNADAELKATFYQEYQDYLRRQNAVDFGDLILLTLELFRHLPDLAQSYSQRWKYIMVDEYQDTNPSQNQLLTILAKEHNNLVVVGDDDQSIYSWRGATVENILSFENQFPNTKVVKLERNYRSTRKILAAANSVIQHNEDRHPKKLWTENPEGDEIVVHFARNDEEEGEWIATKIEELHKKGRSYNDIALFYRTNAQSRVLEDFLLECEIPYRIFGGVSFYQRAEIKDLLAYLRVALNPTSDVDFLRVVNVPRRGIGKKSLESISVAAALPHVKGMFQAVEFAFDGRYDDPEIDAIRSLYGRAKKGIKEFVDAINGIRQSLEVNDSLETLMRNLIDNIGYREYLLSSDPDRAEEKNENVDELLVAMRDFESRLQELEGENSADLDSIGANPSQPSPDDTPQHAIDILRAFLERSALLTSGDERDPEVGSVTLMTVHGAKGLEFQDVFLAGMEDELFPMIREETLPSELEEERRLAYVAITRAKERLFMTAARRRQFRGRTTTRGLSTFVYDIDENLRTVSRNSLPIPAPGEHFSSFSTSDYTFDDFDQRPQRSFQKRRVPTSTSSSSSKTTFHDTSVVVDDYSQTDYTYLEEVVWTPKGEDDVVKSKDLSDKVAVGVTVSHKSFGIGKITAISGADDSAIITVFFPTSGTKKIVRKFLQILG